MVVVRADEDNVVDLEARKLHHGGEKRWVGMWMGLQEHREVLLLLWDRGLVALEDLQGGQQCGWRGGRSCDLLELCEAVLWKLWRGLCVGHKVFKEGVEEGVAFASSRRV